jgi:hypothetical protein
MPQEKSRAGKTTDVVKPKRVHGTVFNDKAKKAIRTAWRRGRRTITIDDRKYNLRKAAGTTTLAFSKTTERPKGKQEKYILVTPADGSLTPMAQVSLSAKDPR